MQRTIWSLVFAVAALAITTQSASAGQFKKAVYYHAGLRPYHVITADFNNDGNADLAFADWLSDQVVILLGNGDGCWARATVPFREPRSLLRSRCHHGSPVGDLNEDGNLGFGGH